MLKEFRFFVFSCALLIVSVTFFSVEIEASFEPINENLINAAYISRHTGPVALLSVKKAPPEPIKETPTASENPNLTWISGYWEWSEELGNFIWITGVWRMSPPGMVWIPSVWHPLDGGEWALLKGFWLERPLEEAVFIEKRPPDAVVQVPGISDSSNYFWNAGYWSYNQTTKEYDWISGSWDLFDPNWVLATPHYEWRPQGYLFIPAYWDWPLDKRGVPYAPVSVSKSDRASEFSPSVVMTDAQIYEMLLVYYPDHLSLCHHIYRYHPDRWEGLAPGWWHWHTWWALPWHNQWWLWWWFTHSEYPTPPGLTSQVTERIHSATPRLRQMMEQTRVPFVVTPRGVLAPSVFFEFLEKQFPSKITVPVIPSDQKAVSKIKDEAIRYVNALEKDDDVEMEVEPSRRGRLYGVRTRVEQVAKERVEAKDVTVTKLPRKPMLSAGDSLQLNDEEISPREQDQRSKPKALNLEIELIPVKGLKNARGTLKSRSSALPKSIPSPDPSLIEPVLPGPRSGPALEGSEVDGADKK